MQVELRMRSKSPDEGHGIGKTFGDTAGISSAGVVHSGRIAGLHLRTREVDGYAGRRAILIRR